MVHYPDDHPANSIAATAAAMVAVAIQPSTRCRRVSVCAPSREHRRFHEVVLACEATNFARTLADLLSRWRDTGMREARFLRDPRAADRAWCAYERLIASLLAAPERRTRH